MMIRPSFMFEALVQKVHLAVKNLLQNPVVNDYRIYVISAQFVSFLNVCILQSSVELI